MRQITYESISAFLSGRFFCKDNTTVRVTAIENGIPCRIELLLFGNLIAIRNVNARAETLEITNAGWKTNTTKERLNALLDVSIVQKKGVWYLNGKEWNGKLIKI